MNEIELSEENKPIKASLLLLRKKKAEQALIDKKQQHQQSNQENRQDLDQKQHVNQNPAQLSLQNVEVILNNKLENYCGKITGTICLAGSDTLPAAVDILLYFGSPAGYPVHKTVATNSSSFAFEDLPPGFYTLVASAADCYHGQLINIKILPGQTIQQTLALEQKLTPDCMPGHTKGRLEQKKRIRSGDTPHTRGEELEGRG